MKKSDIKNTAKRLAGEVGLVNISKESLSRECGIPPGSFAHVAGCKFSELMGELAAEVRVRPIDRYGTGNRRRAIPKLRKQAILAAGLELAERVGYDRVTREELAKAAGVAPGLISHYLGSISEARETILSEAIRLECLPVIAQAVAGRSPLIGQVDERLKRRALDSVIDNKK